MVKIMTTELVGNYISYNFGIIIFTLKLKISELFEIQKISLQIKMMANEMGEFFQKSRFTLPPPSPSLKKNIAFR